MGISIAAVLAMAVSALLVASLIQWFPRLISQDAAHSDSKIYAVDGLRGIVALAVVMHHSIIAYYQHANLAVGWVSPANNFQNQLGSAAVSIFFMISAYLFCGRLIRDCGRLDVVRFVEGRLLRILPLYLVAVCLVVIFAFCVAKLDLKVSLTEITSSILRISLFNFVDIHDVNTVDVGPLIGQIWTLQFEWLLYAIIPVVALLMRRTGTIWPLFAGLAVGLLYSSLFAFFIAGAAAFLLAGFDRPAMTVAWQTTGIIGFAIVLFGNHDSRGWQQAVLLTPIFVAVLQSRGVFAALAYRPLRLLGDMSFSIYLLHGFSLWIICHSIISADRFPALNLVEIFGMLVLSALSAILLAFFGYFFVERPFMRWRPVSGARAVDHDPPVVAKAELHKAI